MIFLRGLLRGVNAFWIFGVSFLRGFLGFFTVYSTGGVGGFFIFPSGGVNGFGFESVPKRAQNEANNLCLIIFAPVLFESFVWCE